MPDKPLTALEQSAAIASGDLSAVALMEMTLARIADQNDAVNAIVSLQDQNLLMDQARDADATDRKGWLHGMPLAVKDLANVKGLPTSMGSPLFAGQIAVTDALHISRLRQAGGGARPQAAAGTECRHR